jgi:hypothetical protein
MDFHWKFAQTKIKRHEKSDFKDIFMQIKNEKNVKKENFNTLLALQHIFDKSYWSTYK